MRQLAVFETQDQADRLAAYLVTQQIGAHAEQEDGTYSVWVRDENQLATAREALEHFRQNPSDPRYRGVETAAEALRRKQLEERAARQKNVVEMRGRWKSGPGVTRKCPLTIGLMVVSVLIGIATNLGDYGPRGPEGLLDALTVVETDALDASNRAGRLDYFASIRAGEVWRLVTPIFIHFSMMHIIFNMWCMFVEGGQVEDRIGTRRYALLVLILAIGGVVGSTIVNQFQQELVVAGGMSGVVYGLFGFLWMKVKFEPAAGYNLDRVTVTVAMAWLVLCILRDYPPFDQYLAGLLKHRVDNAAHLVGLAVGMAAGYAPLLIRRR